MIVLGIDPGARWSGLAVIDTEQRFPFPLLASTTIDRGANTGPLERPPRWYVTGVVAAAVQAVAEYGVELVAVEGIRKPGGHAKGRKGHLIDPAAIMGTAVVFGALFGRSWSVPVTAVPPGGNGQGLPLFRYPEPIATKGLGNDKRRHERSAYDVACQGRTLLRFTSPRSGYGA